MALDYHIRSREIDVNDTAAEELSNLNGDDESKNQSIRVGFTFSLLRLFFVRFLCAIIMQQKAQTKYTCCLVNNRVFLNN